MHKSLKMLSSWDCLPHERRHLHLVGVGQTLSRRHSRLLSRLSGHLLLHPSRILLWSSWRRSRSHQQTLRDVRDWGPIWTIPHASLWLVSYLSLPFFRKWPDDRVGFQDDTPYFQVAENLGLNERFRRPTGAMLIKDAFLRAGDIFGDVYPVPNAFGEYVGFELDSENRLISLEMASFLGTGWEMFKTLKTETLALGLLVLPEPLISQGPSVGPTVFRTPTVLEASEALNLLSELMVLRVPDFWLSLTSSIGTMPGEVPTPAVPMAVLLPEGVDCNLTLKVQMASPFVDLVAEYPEGLLSGERVFELALLPGGTSPCPPRRSLLLPCFGSVLRCMSLPVSPDLAVEVTLPHVPQLMQELDGTALGPLRDTVNRGLIRVSIPCQSTSIWLCKSTYYEDIYLVC